MLDKSKLSLNARLGVKMEARAELVTNRGWWTLDWRGERELIGEHSDEESALNSIFSKKSRSFDSDDAPRSLLNGPDGLLAFVVKAGKLRDLCNHLGVYSIDNIFAGISAISRTSSEEIAKAADAVLPWPEGI